MAKQLRRIILWGIRRYLKYAGRATRDGVADGGYIVRMSAQEYHDYTILVKGRPQNEVYTIVWAAREKGLRV
jgi:hypothetical protein